MNVKMIVVENVPDDCRICNFCNDDDGIEWCSVVYGKKLLKEYGRPSWCPLVVEEVCEWKFYREFPNVVGEPVYKCDYKCSDKSTYTLGKPNYIYCPSCGKRIVYKDGE